MSTLLNPGEAAAYLGVSKTTLAKDRCAGKLKIPFVKIGTAVRYNKIALDKYIENNTFQSTSEADQAAT